jgi:hypothetical protein
MKWRYGLVKIYHGPDSTPELTLCEIYFEKDPLDVVSYSSRGTTFVSDVLEDPDTISKQLTRALKDCQEFPVFDSALLTKKEA